MEVDDIGPAGQKCIFDIREDILRKIFARLPLKDLVSCEKTCSGFSYVCHTLWDEVKSIPASENWEMPDGQKAYCHLIRKCPKLEVFDQDLCGWTQAKEFEEMVARSQTVISRLAKHCKQIKRFTGDVMYLAHYIQTVGPINQITSIQIKDDLKVGRCPILMEAHFRILDEKLIPQLEEVHCKNQSPQWTPQVHPYLEKMGQVVKVLAGDYDLFKPGANLVKYSNIIQTTDFMKIAIKHPKLESLAGIFLSSSKSTDISDQALGSLSTIQVNFMAIPLDVPNPELLLRVIQNQKKCTFFFNFGQKSHVISFQALIDTITQMLPFHQKVVSPNFAAFKAPD